jgi:hypothetical protein
MRHSIYTIIDTMKAKKLSVFENDAKEHNLNLVAVRTSDNTSNNFNDFLYAFYKYNGSWVVKEYAVTTDPGITYRKNPINKTGTAILLPGQYKGMWQIGLHQGKYKALTQKQPCTVIRDNNKDSKLDYIIPPHADISTVSKGGITYTYYLDSTGKIIATTETGVFGINCHKSGKGITADVNNHSAGCVVLADNDKFDDEFIPMCEAAAKAFGNSFTFTLLYELDIKGFVNARIV